MQATLHDVISDALQSACATAAGLNPKFMATKNEVLRLIGEREGVLEAELRRSMGNNPDTSKALRYHLHLYIIYHACSLSRHQNCTVDQTSLLHCT